LINLGAWKSGANPLLDRAVALHDKIEQFLKQSPFEEAPMAESIEALRALLKQERGA
jgi:flagellar biosynthesis/type III secretory pathway ATPase